MRAFEVQVNGKRVCLAGIGDAGVLTTILDSIEGSDNDELYLHVGGLIRATHEHVVWNHSSLRVGDEVRLKIVEADNVDKPQRKHRIDFSQDESQSRAYIRAIAKKLGWKLVTRPRIAK